MEFKVVIVGGSVSGLSLANIFEQFGIDYVLLEAYPNIAPQLGASIGLLPGGLRILDQLGCYDAIQALAGNCYYQPNVRQFNGRIFSEAKPVTFSERLERRTGYSQIFIDRQMLLQVLFDNLKCKDKILTKKRVTRIETVDGCTHVIVEDGSTYTGDIVIGADGIHSAVRKEMWRNAHESGSTLFHPDEESRVRSDTTCAFGISKRPATLPSTPIQINGFFDGWTYMMISAPGDRLYWFLIERTETKFGKSIAKFTKKEEEHVAKQHFGDRVTQTTTFEDIYSNRIASGLVSLQEHVFPQWHFRNMIIIGDAAHKLHPLTAQGGNSAIETAAVLANTIKRKLAQCSEKARLSEEDVKSVLAEVQSRRFKRVAGFLEQGRRTTAFSTRDNFWTRLFVHHFFPRFGDSLLLHLVAGSAEKSPVIDGLAIPKRRVSMAYENATGYNAGWDFWRWGAFGVILLASALYLTKGPDVTYITRLP